MAMLQEARGYEESHQSFPRSGNTLAQCLGPVSAKLNVYPVLVPSVGDPDPSTGSESAQAVGM